jgi:hypothetical protein
LLLVVGAFTVQAAQAAAATLPGGVVYRPSPGDYLAAGWAVVFLGVSLLAIALVIFATPRGRAVLGASAIVLSACALVAIGEGAVLGTAAACAGGVLLLLERQRVDPSRKVRGTTAQSPVR